MRRGFPELGATPLEIFRFLDGGLREGRRGALVTMTAREGSSVRSLGSHMAVLEDGRYAGSFSGGCIEAAIVAEAQQAIGEGKSRSVRYGKGSPYIDIRLPCGGGVDLLFDPDPSPGAVQRTVSSLEGRLPVTLELVPQGGFTVAPAWHGVAAEWRDGRFVVRQAPPLRLLVAGEGGESLALVRLARAFGAEVELMSPDEEIVAAAVEDGAEARALRSSSAPPALEADPWTAIVLLFHSHEWEGPLLRAALASPALWVGAMGSAATHGARLERLAELGVSADQRARVRGPIGLIPATRDPATLALSALAEIVASYQQVLK